MSNRIFLAVTQSLGQQEPARPWAREADAGLSGFRSSPAQGAAECLAAWGQSACPAHVV